MALLLETTNSFGRQHHLQPQRSEPRAIDVADSGTFQPKHACLPPPPADVPQLSTDSVAGVAQCGGASAFWFDAAACTRCEQHAASLSCSSHSASERWHDALSDSALSTCSSSVPDCSAILQEGRERSLADSIATARSLDTALHSALEQRSLEEDAQRRQAAAQAAAQLQELQAQLDAREAAHRDQLEDAWRQTEQARQCAHQAQQQAESASAAAAAASEAAAAAVVEAEATSEAQVAAARLVSSVFGRILGRAEAQEELVLLQKRVEQLCSMNSAMGAQSWLRGAETQDSLQRQLMHAGMAVGCAALGLAGVYVVTRRSR